MKNLKTVLAISLIGMSLTGCSDKEDRRDRDDRPITQTASERRSGTAKNIEEAGKDLRQEACEMVDGKLECGVERLQREARDRDPTK